MFFFFFSLLFSLLHEVQADYALYEQPQTLVSAGVQFLTQPSTVKLSIKIQGWNFTSSDFNATLTVFFNFTTTPPITSVITIGTDSQGTTSYRVLSSSQVTTIALLGYAEVDDSARRVSASVQGGNLVVMEFPRFAQGVDYDPDLSVTLTGSTTEGGDGSSSDLWWH